jgi:dipeptidyl aminopeptidase/acylaminoacyl peptidase
VPTRVIAVLLAVLPLSFAIEARAELPPLIPREILIGNPVKESPTISPDGARLAYLAPGEDGVMNIWVRTRGRTDDTQITHDAGQGIWTYAWAHDSRHLLYIQDKNGDENYHVYASDLASGDARDLTPFEGAAAQELLTDRNHPNEILVGLNKRDPALFDMHRIRLDTGEVTLEVENPGDVTDWAIDQNFRIRAATALDAQTNDTILRVRDEAGGPWRDLVRWPFWEAGEVLYRKVIGFTGDGTQLLVQTSMNGDKSRIALLDMATGDEVRTIAADDSCDVSNTWWAPEVMRDPATHEVQAVGFDYLIPRWTVIDPAVKDDFEALGRLGRGAFMIAGRDDADRLWVVRYASPSRPPNYVLYDRATRTTEPIFESMPALNGYALTTTRPVTYAARDGLVIPAYLTLPPGVEPRNLPFVIMPHGGPWARDSYGFDPWVQLLANRGYAVLQPNFRGSVGYGKAFLNASTEQWGVGAMQHDLTDGVRWAIAEGIADPKRVAIMGGSYGGYATLAGIAFTPDLYACAVDIVGPSNVATLFESMPPYWKVRKVRWRLRVGDVEGDAEFNRRISPLFHADAIRAPLLIGHGANDPRVKLSESEAIAAALRERNLPVTLVVYPDEGHGFVRPENNLDFVGRVEEFLARYLGARAEPWREVPGSSAEVR